MARLPPIKRLVMSDFVSQSSWIGPLLQNVNNFSEAVYNTLNRNLSITDNTTGAILPVVLTQLPTAAAPVQVPWTKPSVPQAILIGNVQQRTVTPGNSLTTSGTLIPSYQLIPATITGTITAGSSTVSSASSITRATQGAQVQGVGIPVNTYVASSSGSTIIMTQPAAQSITANPLDIGGVFSGAPFLEWQYVSSDSGNYIQLTNVVGVSSPTTKVTITLMLVVFTG